ncbi:MAG: phosphoribosylamine--glycine ligase [Spirochaetaceae bacterium]|nr:phosphoribosylamine--glycine ligase [Spirochaetaceae bacterium]
MKILVVGNGGREHAMLWALGRGADQASGPAKSGAKGGSRNRSGGAELFCAPGSAGTAGLARNLPLDTDNPAAVVAACRELGIALVIVGPEVPLAAGLVDALAAAGIAAFGPPRKAAALEASKAFARSFCERRGVPCAATARFAPGRGAAELRRFLDERRGGRLVLKKSGLAAGKGVLDSDDPAELRAFGEAVLETDELLAEEFLVGRELSVFGLCTEKGHVLLEPAADHKKALAGDRGPNTGGMGAVSPLPFADAALMARIEREIVAPSFEGMAAEGLSYRGVLFFGVMATAEGPKLLEYNVRFGDPETQSLLPRLESGFEELCAAVAEGSLPSPRFSRRHACGIVVAAPGYPISHPVGLPVDLGAIDSGCDSGNPEAQAGPAPLAGETEPTALLFHAATGRDAEGRLRTGGGRSFTAVGLGPDWSLARERAYALARKVNFEGAWFRPDIGDRIFGAPR